MGRKKVKVLPPLRNPAQSVTIHFVILSDFRSRYAFLVF